MEFYSYEELAGAVLILLGLAGSFVLIGNCVELIRKWVGAHTERQARVEDKVDFLKGESTRHKQDYKDVVYLKRQVGTIEESVQKIDHTLDKFITKHEKEMSNLNKETAIQTGAIKSLLDNAIDDTNKETLAAKRKELDEYLINRGR